MSYQKKLIDNINLTDLGVFTTFNSNVVKAPSGGSGFAAGKYVFIAWVPHNTSTFCKIYYSTDKITWTSENIPLSGSAQYMSVAVDSQGNVYVLYNTSGAGTTYLYILIKTTTWQSEETVYTLPSTSGFQYPSPGDNIFVGPDDTVYCYVSYGGNATSNENGLKIAIRTGVNTYTITTLVTNGIGGGQGLVNFTFLSNFDNNDDIYCVYNQRYAFITSPHYAKLHAGSWSSPVDLLIPNPVPNQITLLSMAMDNSGIMYILYRLDGSPSIFKFIYGTPGSWSTPEELPFTSGFNFEGGGMSIDQTGTIQFVWSEYMYGDVDYTVNTYRQKNTGSGWSTKEFLSIDTDPFGNNFYSVQNVMYGKYPSSMRPQTDFIGIFYADTTPDSYATEFNEYYLIYIGDDPVPQTTNTAPLPDRYSIFLRNPGPNGGTFEIFNQSISALQWEFNVVGGDGVCTMTAVLPYEALPNLGPDADIQIYDTDENGVVQLFYRGYLESKEPILDINNQFNMSFTGYSGQLKRARVKKTYLNMELSAIVKDILDNYIVPNTGVTYDPVDIIITDFVPDVIQFDDLADVCLQTLADLAGNVQWGVDRFKNFFFKPLNENIVHILKVGKEVKLVDPIYDFSTIINRLIIKGGTVDGVTFEDEVDNTESQRLYGLRTNIVSNSAIVTGSVSQQYGSQLLADQARIKMRASIDITKNKKLFEKTLPLGAFSLLTTPVPRVLVYNDPDAIYGTGVIYGSRWSFQAERITYVFADDGSEVTITGGAQTPDISLHIKKLEYQISQLRSG